MIKGVYPTNKKLKYLQLLRLTCTSKDIISLCSDNNELIEIFNNIKDYKESLQRLIPLLKAKVNQLGLFNDLRRDVQELLDIETKKGIITELAKDSQLKIIIDVLADSKIPMILLKGSAFNKTIYSREAPRTSNDIDILVKSEHWEIVNTILGSILNYSEKIQPDVFGDLYEVSLIPKGQFGSAVDLHKGLIHPYLFKINEKELWAESIELVGFNNKLVRTLSPEHSLIHQAIHAFKDMDFSKYNLVDTFEIIEQLKPNVQSVIEISKKWGVQTPVFFLLFNCKNIMGTDIDSSFLDKISPNILIRTFAIQLLKSPYRQPKDHVKCFRYRLNQILAQFVFTMSFTRPLSLHWLYIKSVFTIK
jgi:hypothetical protein